MKKLITFLLMTFLLCACELPVGKSDGKELYRSVSDTSLAKITKNQPDLIEIYEGSSSHLLTIDDPETIKELVSLFIEGKLGNGKQKENDDELSITFYFENDISCLTFYGEDILIYGKDGENNYYGTSGCTAFLQKAASLLEEHFGKPVEQKEVLVHDAVKIIFTGSALDDDGNLAVNFSTKNASPDFIYGFRIEPIVNGFPILSYQEIILMKESEMDYGLCVPTIVMKDFGIKDLGTLEFVLHLYRVDGETKEDIEEIDVSKLISFDLPDLDYMDNEYQKESVVYEEDGVSVCFKTDLRQENFLGLEFLIENEKQEDVSLSFNSVLLNEEEVNADDLNDVFVIDVPQGGCRFVYIPLPTFNYDEENGKVIPISVDDLHLELSVSGNEGLCIIDQEFENQQ